MGENIMQKRVKWPHKSLALCVILLAERNKRNKRGNNRQEWEKHAKSSFTHIQALVQWQTNK